MARIEIRIVDEAKEAWEGKAADAGLSLSDLIRHAVEGTEPMKRNRVDVDPVLLRQLAQIGNNLNQLARWANRDKRKVEALAVIARLIEIDRELSDLRQSIEGSAGAN
uniref:Uncharacterized protein n=1 Tax=uncultured prokaryote TaxID=198431 RepID=A0A0H5Q3Y8_9ZZZZ|nr:hypothetical protein [uncultured prokaryote]